jgi:hypothetical protein
LHITTPHCEKKRRFESACNFERVPIIRFRERFKEQKFAIYAAKSSTQRGGEILAIAESEHFHIRQSPSSALSLITTPEYFVSGLGTLVKLQATVLQEMSIPVRAYVRVLAAHDHFKQWIAIPLVLLEKEPDS